MENHEFGQLVSKLFKNIYLRAKESYILTFLVVVSFVVVGIPLIEFLQHKVKEFPYIPYLENLWFFITDQVKVPGLLIIVSFLFLVLLIYRLYRQILTTSLIQDNFKKGLRKWSLPLESGWITEDCEDAPGKMLNLSGSIYPGILKDAYDWYDYEISFLFKVNSELPEDKRNFAVVVRAENNSNGVMLQLTKTHFRPHLIFNGTFILDDKNFEKLPSYVKSDRWEKVKVSVRENIIELYIFNTRLIYKIPVLNYRVEANLLTQDVSLSEIEQIDKTIGEQSQKAFEKLKIYLAVPDTEKEKKASTLDEYLKESEKLPSYNRLVIDFQKGSVGLRVARDEQVYIRDFTVKKI